MNREITEYFDCVIEYDYIFAQFIEEMYFDSTEASFIVMTSRLTKAFRNKKLTPTSRAFLIYLKHSKKFTIPEKFENK